jgi:hypothetical protein
MAGIALSFPPDPDKPVTLSYKGDAEAAEALLAAMDDVVAATERLEAIVKSRKRGIRRFLPFC